jgi:hypothetical protein
VVNLFNNKLPDLDFRNIVPDTINIDLGMIEKSNSDANLD